MCFFDESYWLSFADRDSDEERWKPLPPESSLATRLGFIVPPGFHEQGYSTYARDDSFEPPFEEVGEVWIYNDVGQ
ncbi:DUF3916 domain-containing protein [Asticcacaulis taihuensis]|uniref:DUF3916 domain-containing protein n=1 Tax=Asticcacaulis taihuensis TaxID=260084 RepID=UPI00147D3BB0